MSKNIAPIPKHQTRESFEPLPRCQAYAMSGYQCKKKAINGKRVCRSHGGASLGGVLSPRFETGKYSKYVPKNMLPQYKEAMQDETLLDLSNEIHLIDARLKILLERADTGGGTTNWVDLNRTWRGMLTAQRRGDENSVAELVRGINDIINRGLHDSMAWEDIGRLIDRRQRLVSAEAKRLTDMEQTITAEKAIGLMIFIADAVRGRLVDYMDKGKKVDKRLLSNISTDITNLLGSGEK